MLEIKSVNINEVVDLKNFLKNVPSIKKIDDNIIKNASIILNNNKIIGCISYEIFDQIALIRYFVFKKNIESNLLLKMLENLINNCKSSNVNKLICFADNKQILDLFLSFDFKIIKNKIFIDEEIISNTIYMNSSVLEKNICK